MNTAVAIRKRETTVDGTWQHTAAVVTPTTGSALGLARARTSCRVTVRPTPRRTLRLPARRRVQHGGASSSARRQHANVFRRSFAPRPSSAATLREALTEYLAANRVEDPAVRQIVLCADEAFINAVDHAAGCLIDVVADVRNDELTLEVTDGGSGFDAAHFDHDAQPDLLGEHGRGLFLIRHLMDDLQILSDKHGTTLRMGLALAA